MKARGIALFGAGLAALAAAGYSAYWVWGAGAVEDALDHWATGQRRAGVAIGHAPAVVAGFPGAVRVTLADFQATAPGGAPWIAAPALTVTVAPWRPLDYALELDGPVTGGAPGGARWTAARAVGGARLGPDGRLARAELALEGVDLALPALPGDATAARARLNASAPAKGGLGAPGTAVELRLESLLLPDWAGNPLGRTVQAVSLRAETVGPVPRGGDARALAAWREAGGAVDIPALRLDWGAMRLDGAGRIGLDRWLRPHGALALTIAGYREALDGAVAAGMMDRGAAQGVTLALSLMARPGADGRPAVAAPLRLEDGLLSLGPLAIARLRPLARSAADPDAVPGDVAPGDVAPGVSRAGASAPSEAPMPVPAPPPARLRAQPGPPPTLAPDWAAPSD